MESDRLRDIPKLSMASETLSLRWYGTDLGGTAIGFIELSV